MASLEARERVDHAHQQVVLRLSTYLDALYHGDVDTLRSSFHPAAFLFAEVRGAIMHKSLDAYLEGVASRKSPASLNEPYRMSLLSVEIVGDTASAKVQAKMGENNYHNFLSLLKVDGKWVIVNKLFTHVEG
jgi:hypothetical protein